MQRWIARRKLGLTPANGAAFPYSQRVCSRLSKNRKISSSGGHSSDQTQRPANIGGPEVPCRDLRQLYLLFLMGFRERMACSHKSG